MKTSIGLLVAFGVIGLWVCGNATWVLILVNLLWLLVKGTVLVSWWWPIGTGIYFVSALGGLLWLKLSD